MRSRPICLEEWAPNNESDESFTKDPPNATVSVFSTDGSKIRDAVVVLKTAKLEGDELTFDVDVLEGELTGGDGPAALFIDRFGFGGFTRRLPRRRLRRLPRRGLPRRLRPCWGCRPRRRCRRLATIPTSHAAPGIGELPMQLLRSAALRSVRRRSVRGAPYPYCGYYPYPPCY